MSNEQANKSLLKEDFGHKKIKMNNKKNDMCRMTHYEKWMMNKKQESILKSWNLFSINISTEGYNGQKAIQLWHVTLDMRLKNLLYWKMLFSTFSI